MALRTCTATATAAAEGAIGEERIKQILEILRRIPAEVAVEDREHAEKTFATLARDAGPRQVSKLGDNLLA